MKKLNALLITLFLSVMTCGFAQGIDNLYFGVEGTAALPVAYSGDEKIAGFGAGGALEVGYDLNGFLLGTHVGYTFNTDNGNYMKKLSDLFITIDVSKIIDKELLSFMPEVIALRPSIGAGANLINGEYYRNKNYKAADVSEPLKCTSAVFGTGLEVEFTGISKVIPYAGADVYFTKDTEGLFVFPQLNLGVRTTIGRLTAGKAFEATITPVESYFTPDGDGDHDTITFKTKASYILGSKGQNWKLEIIERMNDREKVIKTFEGDGVPPKKITWDGSVDVEKYMFFSVTEFTAKLTVTNTLGEETVGQTEIGTGLLVEQTEDGKLKIRVPPIAFDPDAATFNSLTDRQKKSNERIISLIAEGLSKYPSSYKIVVQGHANPVTGTEEEEINELIPLSEERAKAIKEKLVELGIAEKRLSVEGRGGRDPIAGREESYKNRRVEFILYNR